jgi:hypothetical protein
VGKLRPPYGKWRKEIADGVARARVAPGDIKPIGDGPFRWNGENVVLRPGLRLWLVTKIAMMKTTTTRETMEVMEVTEVTGEEEMETAEMTEMTETMEVTRKKQNRRRTRRRKNHPRRSGSKGEGGDSGNGSDGRDEVSHGEQEPETICLSSS